MPENTNLSLNLFLTAKNRHLFFKWTRPIRYPQDFTKKLSPRVGLSRENRARPPGCPGGDGKPENWTIHKSKNKGNALKTIVWLISNAYTKCIISVHLLCQLYFSNAWFRKKYKENKESSCNKKIYCYFRIFFCFLLTISWYSFVYFCFITHEIMVT